MNQQQFSLSNQAGADPASGGTSIQTWGSPDQIFQHAIRYNPIHNTLIQYTSTKYGYKHKLTKTTVDIAQIFLETCIHYNK
jgi:hypothetical protein